MFDLLDGGSKATRSEEFKGKYRRPYCYIAISFITLLHVLVPRRPGEAATWAVIGAVLMAIAIAWFEVLPRVKRRREQKLDDSQR